MFPITSIELIGLDTPTVLAYSDANLSLLTMFLYFLFTSLETFFTLTLEGSMYWIKMASNLPQAAPVSRFGMNSPLDTARPNVHVDSKK